MPVSLATLKTHLRVDHEEDDSYIESLLASAVDFCENYTHRVIAQRVELVTADRFPASEWVLPISPVRSVDSLTYMQSGGDLITLAEESYRLLEHVDPPVLLPSTSWPADTAAEPGAVRLSLEAGYEELPPGLHQALLLLCGHYYENREVMRERFANVNEMPFAVSALLYPYKVVRV